MLQKTRGVVLRAVKYGETSLIVCIFTELYGVQSYMVQGIRNTKSKYQRAGLLQPATLLDIVAYHKPQQSLQRIKEFQPAYIYTHLQEEIVKNTIALFSVEVLLRLLPEHAPVPEAFDFVFNYLSRLDQMETASVANFPIYLTIHISRILGYDIIGSYSAATPHLNLREGAFTTDTPVSSSPLTNEDTKALGILLNIQNFDDLSRVDLNAETRYRMLDWYLEFLHNHTQHMGNIRSLSILRTILH